MRLAIFGGSFDPPHIGHLIAASDAFEELELDRLTFVPAATQPLKAGRAIASATQRLAMVRLLIGSDQRFDVSTVELDRAGLSFTVDTLTHFAGVYPDAERFLLLGADVLETFAQWREPDRVAQLAQPIVLTREGETPALPPMASRFRRLRTRRVDISSTEVRERVRQGKPIRAFVTGDVAALIERDGLYR